MKGQNYKAMNNRCDEITRLSTEGGKALRLMLQTALPQVQALMNRFKPYLFIVQDNPRELPEFNNNATPASWFRDALSVYVDVKKEVAAVCDNNEQVPPFVVNTERIKKQLEDRIRENQQMIMTRLEQQVIKVRWAEHACVCFRVLQR